MLQPGINYVPPLRPTWPPTILAGRTLAMTCFAWLHVSKRYVTLPARLRGIYWLRNGSLSVGDSKTGIAGSRRAEYGVVR